MATPQNLVFALFVMVLMYCTNTSLGARSMPGEREIKRSEPPAGIPLPASHVTQSTTETWWHPMWIKVLPKNLQSLRAMIPVSASSSSPSSATQLASSSAQPMFMGFPGFGFPGMGFPGMGFPGMGFPHTGMPGVGFPGMGFPGSGFPGPIVPPI